MSETFDSFKLTPLNTATEYTEAVNAVASEIRELKTGDEMPK